MASCSDYFLSMFTSGMKESQQNEIELKGITSKGLEKCIDVIYTSKTTLECSDDIFDLIATATHLQCIPVINYCEKNFLNGINCTNFNDFMQTAKLYRMNSILKQIDLFIMHNLLNICNANCLKLLTYEQLISYITHNEILLKEIDLFNLIWKWLNETTQNSTSETTRLNMLRELLKHIRFALITPNDLVNKIQVINEIMSDQYCRDLILMALNYHVIPYSQSIQSLIDNTIRSPVTCVVCIGGREINPTPCLHDQCYLIDFNVPNSTVSVVKREFTQLPTHLSHHQTVVLNNYIYVIGGCSTQCAHGESAVNNCYRYDPRFNTWLPIASMNERRAYFYACTLNNRVYAIGGKNRDGAIATVEYYDALLNKWFLIQSMPAVYHAHAGAVLNNIIYVAGGYSQGHFTADLQAYFADLDQWEDLCPMNSPRGWHCMCEAMGKLYVFGGCHLNGNQQAQPILQTEYYTPDYDQWTIVSSLNNLHKEASCVRYFNYIYIIGGYNIQAKCGQKVVSRYDYINDKWENFGQFSIGQTGFGCCLIDLPAYLLHDLNNKSCSITTSNSNVQFNAVTTIASASSSIIDNSDDNESETNKQPS